MKYRHLAITSLVLLLSLPSHAEKAPAVMTVTGQALLQVEPDQLTIDLGVTSQAETARQALEQNNGKMDAVLAAMTPLGLDASAIRTRQFQLQPIWSQRPRQPAEDWQATITGYKVSNTVVITTPRLKLAGDIIGAATAAGANRVNAVTFSLADPRIHRAAAIKQASENAASDANSLATAAGQSIIRVLSLSLDNSSISPIPVRQDNRMRTMAADLAPPIQAGEVPVRASVTIHYEIK